MDMKSIGKGIISAFAVLGAIVAGIGAVYLLAFVYTVVLGSIFNVAQTGDLPITTGANTTLTTMETGFNSAVTSVNSGTTFATSLIPVAVVLLVFAGLVAGGVYGYKKMKGGNSGSY